MSSITATVHCPQRSPRLPRQEAKPGQRMPPPLRWGEGVEHLGRTRGSCWLGRIPRRESCTESAAWGCAEGPPGVFSSVLIRFYGEKTTRGQKTPPHLSKINRGRQPSVLTQASIVPVSTESGKSRNSQALQSTTQKGLAPVTSQN